MGWKSAKIAEMREYIELLRPLWRGEYIAPYGSRIHLKGATGRPVPVYVSATGPKMLQFAGAVADGVIIVAGIAKDSVENALANVDIGARGAGRRLEDIDIVTGTFCHISDDWRNAMALARPYAAVYLSRYPESLRSFGIPEAEAKSVSGVYPDMAHAEDWDRAMELSHWVPEEVLEAFCEKFCLMGTPDEVAAKVRRMAGYGIRSLYIRGFYSYAMPTTVAEAFARTVIPRFR
jgi:5,10-methylenetetrahydromethanopterin reductase